MSLHLSKSRYCSALQCPKMLWLNDNMPEMCVSTANQTAIENGYLVGDLARGLFGEYELVTYGDLEVMQEQTKLLLDKGTPVIAEASFSYDGCFCSVDILRNLGDSVEIYEVKSSTEVKDIHLEDAAYQYYVLTKSGYNVSRVCIVRIDNTYVRQGELDIHKLFAIEDITAFAKDGFTSVEHNIPIFRRHMAQEHEPDIGIGMQCFNPYECCFKDYCFCHLPKPNVFDVAGLATKKKCQLYRDGIISFPQLEQSCALNLNQHTQVHYELHDEPARINKANIRELLDSLSFPLYFLDFESYQAAIPPFDGSRPYEQLVFQYSLHYIEHEGGLLLHKEYLAYPDGDPRRGVAEQLCRDIPKDVCVTAYNMGFEKSRIKELARLYPDLADHLMNIHDHIVDLLPPFRSKDYYTRAMKGSYSIKYVLPALFPDDPALDYHNLEGVHNGGEASEAFIRMADMHGEELERCRNNLLKYCCLDTYAMVRIWEKLKEAAR